jgi:conjugative relaxase-like TrwC/TraI family protein
VFSPKKFSAAAIASIGSDLWGYLEGSQAHADYYIGADGTPTSGRVELHGKLLERLGVSKLDREVFERLAAGCHPVSGERLVQTSHVPTALIDRGSERAIVEGGFHVPGIDCNLSPPKSVSALLPFLSAGGRAELEAAHLAAVRATLRELEARVPLCRPTVNGEQVHTPGELGIAVFTHHTSRPSPEVAAQPGRPPDPQLHSHAFLFNVAWCQGRFLAIDSKPLLRFASTAEAIYTCELAAQLQQLGYRLRWQQTRRGPIFDLEGVEPRVTELFSSRHRHIHQLADQFQATRGRPPTPIERRHLAARDRSPKTDACRAPHWPAYRQVLRDRGLPEPAPHRHRRSPELAPLSEREAAVRARLLAPDGLTRNDATFDSASLTKTAFQAAAGLLNVEEARRFLERFLAGVDLVPVTTLAGPRLTTQTLLDQEQAILTTAHAKARSTATAPAPALVERTAAEIEARAGYRLSDEQRAALEHLCAPVGWASLEGHAGTGKTTAVRAVVCAYQHNHQPVFLVSTAADTAHRTASELGLDCGYTIEAFTHAVQAGTIRPAPRTVVIVEEAAMVDTPRMHRLLQAAGPAIIRTLGDPEQAQPVGPGGWHQQVDSVIGGHAELTHVIRQRDPDDRAVCQAIRQGNAAWALDNLHRRGRLHLAPDRSTAIKEIVHVWDQHRRRHGLDEVKIVTDTNNATIDALNGLCQAKRLAAGELHGPAVEIRDQLTGRHEHLYAGDRISFIRPYRQHGDYIANGTRGEVSDLRHGRVTIRCDDGHTLMLQTSNLPAAQPLRLAYAGHALKLQGGQADVVLVLPGSWQTSRQSAYSMATRCVQELHVFIDTQTQSTGEYRDWDPIDVLAARWTIDAKKLPASPTLHPDEPHRGHLAATPVHGADLQLHSDAMASPSRSEGHWIVTPWPAYPHPQTDRQAVDDLEISLDD